MTATDIRLNGSLPANGPILYDVIFICVYTCTCLFYMANGLNKELLNLNLNLNLNSDHSGERLSQNGDNESLYLHDLKNVVYNYYYVAYAFVHCV